MRLPVGGFAAVACRSPAGCGWVFEFQGPVPTGGLETAVVAEASVQCDCLQGVPNAFWMLEAARASARSALGALRPRFI